MDARISKGDEVIITVFSGGGRKAFSEDFRKRSQTAPLNQTDPVRVYDHRIYQSPTHQKKASGAAVDSRTSAITASAAPSVQSKTERKRRLGVQQEKDERSEVRATHLQEQLNHQQQRLQQLESIQLQQIQQQNRLLASALDSQLSRGTDAVSAPSSGSHSSGRSTSVSFETSAPRKVVPKPTVTFKAQRSSLRSHESARLQVRDNQSCPERCRTADNELPEPSRDLQMSSDGGEEAEDSVVTGTTEARRDQDETTTDAFPVQKQKPGRSGRSICPSPPSMAPPPSTPLIPEILDSQGTPLMSFSLHPKPPVARASILKNLQPSSSIMDDVGQMLEEIRHRRKVLEENLEAMSRANHDEMFYLHLDALTDRKAQEKLEIKRTVDAWLNIISKEVQEDLARERCDKWVRLSSGPVVSERKQQQHQPVQRKQTTHQAGTSAAFKKASGTALNTASERSAPEDPYKMIRSLLLKSESDEEFLVKRYGKALLERQQQTLMKKPKLQHKSTTAQPRPEAAEETLTVTSRRKEPNLKPSSVMKDTASAAMKSFSHTVGAGVETTASCAPPLPPQASVPLNPPIRLLKQTLIQKPMLQNKSTATEPRPDADAEETGASRRNQPNQKPPSVIKDKPAAVMKSFSSPEVKAPAVQKPDAAGMNPLIHREEEEEEEEDLFPGTRFLSVTDIDQTTDVDLPAPVLVDGIPSPPPAAYHGPAFPPQPRPPASLTLPILSIIQQRESLDRRLVDWVEQQIMATRLIPPVGPVETSVTTNTVEAAGASGFQFVLEGEPVEYEEVRQAVLEVLTEMASEMMSEHQAAQSAPTLEVKAVPSPVPSPVPYHEEPPPPVRSPDLPERPSTADSLRSTRLQEPASPGPAAVATPTATPVPSPTRIATPTRRSANQSPESPRLPSHQRESPQEDQQMESENPPPPPLPVKQEAALPLPDGSSESSSSVEPSSSSVPDTESSSRHEFLLRNVLQGEAFFTPERTDLNFTLQGVLDLDSDPPSEGEVIGASRFQPPLARIGQSVSQSRQPMNSDLLSEGEVIGASRFLARNDFLQLPLVRMGIESVGQSRQPMDCDPLSEGEVIAASRFLPLQLPLASAGIKSVGQSRQLMGEEESSGELSEGQVPRLTASDEELVMKSLVISPHATLSSPGQLPALHAGRLAGGDAVEGSDVRVMSPSSPYQKAALSSSEEDF